MPVYSYSRLGSYRTCPRQYKFKYIEKPDIEKTQTIEQFLGSTVHEALEHCYKLIPENKILTEAELLALYERLWKENYTEDIRVVRQEKTANDYFEVGKYCLRLYHKRHYPFDNEITLGLELRINFKLDADSRYQMMGFIDRLSRDNTGRLLIQDYKTSNDLPTQPKIDEEEQLALYQIAVQEMFPDNNGIELIWHYLKHDTALRSIRTPEQIEKLRHDCIERIRAIEQAAELDNFPTTPSNLCDWCEYKQYCPAFGNSPPATANGQIEIGELAPAEIADLVDEYLSLDDQRKDIDKQLKALRAKLEHQVKDKAGGVLAGNEGMGLKITSTTQLKLPTKSSDPDKFAEVTSLILDSGVYEDYSVLDVRAVEKALKDCRFDDPLIHQLTALAEPTTSFTLRRVKTPGGREE